MLQETHWKDEAEIMSFSFQSPIDNILFYKKLYFFLSQSHHNYSKFKYGNEDADYSRFNYLVDLSPDKRWVVWTRNYSESVLEEDFFYLTESDCFIYHLDNELRECGYFHRFLSDNGSFDKKYPPDFQWIAGTGATLSIPDLKEEYDLNDLGEAKIRDTLAQKFKITDDPNEKICRNIAQMKLKWQSKSVFTPIHESRFSTIIFGDYAVRTRFYHSSGCVRGSYCYDNEFYLFKINSENDIKQVAYFYNFCDSENRGKQPLNNGLYYQFTFYQNKIDFRFDVQFEGKSQRVSLDLSNLVEEDIQKKIDLIYCDVDTFMQEQSKILK